MIGINKIVCPYCGARRFHENNNFSETKVGENIFCLACEERFSINKIWCVFGIFILTTNKNMGD